MTYSTSLIVFKDIVKNGSHMSILKKTKIMIFGKGRQPLHLSFYYDCFEIEIVKELKYLGILFSRNGSFLSSRIYAVQRATRAMYGII